MSALLQAIAAGDLTARMHGEFHGVFAQMRDDANATAEQLASIVGRIKQSGNLQSLSALLQAIAAGDLTARMHGEFHGVFAQMRDDANATAEQLASIVGRIKQSAGSINAAGRQ